MLSTLRRLLGPLGSLSVPRRAQQSVASTTTPNTTSGDTMVSDPFTDVNGIDVGPVGSVDSNAPAEIISPSAVVFAQPHLRQLVFDYHADIIEERERLRFEREREEQEDAFLRRAARDPTFYGAIFHIKMRDGELEVVGAKRCTDAKYQPGYKEEQEVQRGEEEGKGMQKEIVEEGKKESKRKSRAVELKKATGSGHTRLGAKMRSLFKRGGKGG